MHQTLIEMKTQSQSLQINFHMFLFQGEVDQWEDKVRSLKEELLQLESQKKGLEAVLRRHQGPCKIQKSEINEN